MKNFNCVLFILLFCTPFAFSQVIPQNPDLLKIREEISKMVSDSTIPSMAVAVIKDGKILWQEAIGYSDIKKQEKATLQSVYPLGSVSKSITSTGLMQMINTGQLSLFENIQNIISPIKLKDINGKIPEIKLWQLLSNNAGLNHGYGVFENGYLPKTDEEIKQFYESSTIVAFAPGETYHYSNHSFDVAELIVEKKTGEKFQDYMSEYLFKPLGMHNTYAYPDESKQSLFVSTYSAKLKKLSPVNLIFPAGGAGFWSSIQDLTQYALFHMGEIKNDKVISGENLKLMHEFRQGQGDMFGIGWFNTDGNLYSNGNVSGGNAVIAIDLKNNLAVICLLNRTSNDGIADQIAGKITQVFTKEENTEGRNFYQRFYGTRYSAKYDLIGTWKGKIQDPVTLKEIPFSLSFDQEGKIILGAANQQIELNNPKYNLLQQLNTQFQLALPEIFDGEVNCSMTLQRDHNTFNGYIFYEKNLEHSFYTMPLYVEVEKVE